MTHRAGQKSFAGKGYTHHTVFGGTAVAGFKDEESAQADAADRNERAKKLGTRPQYTVEEASEAVMVADDE